jgi:CheY-like chemotaxis protein
MAAPYGTSSSGSSLSSSPRSKACIVATIVKRHAGAIRIISTPGEGTDFQVFFPASVAASTPDPTPSSSHQTPPRGCVLVVDAKASIRQITAQMLETKGWTCVQAGDLCSAVEALAASPESFGLVVLDSEGDSPSSIQAVERLREVRPQLPCLFMTSIPQPAIGQTPAQTIRLQRPFSAAQLSHAASALTQPGSNT